MLKGHTIAVVVPCFNEQKLISRVLETMPTFVDRIIVVDDCSTDNTVEIVERHRERDQRVTLVVHEANQGVGAAIATGYKTSLSDSTSVTAVMAGDAQMDPAELESIVTPIINDECDFTKGNRLFSGDAWAMIPRTRYLGNAALSFFTKIASGYWHIADSQSGYTAINLRALKTLDWDQMYKRYGQPNDLLVRLNVYNFRVRDVPIIPIYGIGEQSGVKPIRMIPGLFYLIVRLFIFRMFQKYIIRDTHPLVLFYALGWPLLLAGQTLGFYLFLRRIMVGPVAETSALLAGFLFISGMQLILFAMWMDMENNKTLR